MATKRGVKVCRSIAKCTVSLDEIMSLLDGMDFSDSVTGDTFTFDMSSDKYEFQKNQVVITET